MRYGLNAAIIAGIFCLALGEPAPIGGDRFSDYLPGSREISPPPGLSFGDDVYFYGGKTNGGVKLHPDGQHVARNFVNRSWRCPPLEVTPS